MFHAYFEAGFEKNLSIFEPKIEKKKRRRNLFAQNTFTNKSKLPIGLSECNNIRKKLNKSHTGKVPSKAANS